MLRVQVILNLFSTENADCTIFLEKTTFATKQRPVALREHDGVAHCSAKVPPIF